MDELIKEAFMAQASLEEATHWYQLCLLDGKAELWQMQRVEELRNVYACRAAKLATAQLKAKTCPECGKPLNYDTFEDCYLCGSCHWLGYPKDFGEKDNKDAGIWKLGQSDG